MALLFAVYWERQIDCFNGTFGHTEAAFLTKIIFNIGLFILKRDCLRRAHFQAVSAFCAAFFIDNGYHQSTIPKRYPSCIALLSRLGFLASPIKYTSFAIPFVSCRKFFSGLNIAITILSASIVFSASGPVT